MTEWYREGVCGGGHYKMEIRLMDANGEVSDPVSAIESSWLDTLRVHPRVKGTRV